MVTQAEHDRVLAAMAAMQLALDEKDRLLQPTTFHELLEACHKHLFEQLRVQSNADLATTGTHTSITGKLAPHYLRPWRGFSAERERVYRQIYDVWHPQANPVRDLPSLRGILDKAKLLEGMISSESDLTLFHHKVTEEYVGAILKAMVINEALSKNYGRLGNGIEFQNQALALRNGDPEVEERRQQMAQDAKKTEPVTPTREAAEREPDSIPDVPPLNADQYLVAWKDNKAKLILIEELKAPHKLTQQFLKLGLTNPKTHQLGSLDMRKIRDRMRIGDTDEQKKQFDAQKLVAAAATQTYSYMLPAGLGYGCIVTGEAFLFLHIAEDDPLTLLYHLSIPAEDVSQSGDSSPDYAFTAVAQLATFAVLASECEPRSKWWRNKAVKNAMRWLVDYAAVERALKTPRSQRRESPEYSAWKGRKGPVPEKKHHTRSKDKDDDNDPSNGPNGHNSSSDDASSESSDAFAEFDDTPSKSNDRSRNGGNEQGSRGSSKRQAPQHHAYCTQACLLGMMRQSAIDENCPNAALHPRKKSNPTCHLMGPKKFPALVQAQLAETLDDHIEDLQISGARGMLFRIRLVSHGYVFVGKGTVAVFIRDLQHEGRMYQRLKKLQGIDIPVYLGNIDLVEQQWYDYCLCVCHMMLLSYGGGRVYNLNDSMEMQVKSFATKLNRYGVKHGDLREANMLWNAELQRLVFIDFERSTIAHQQDKTTTARAFREISPNKQLPNKKPTHQKLSEPRIKSRNEPLAGNETKASSFDDEDLALELPIPSPKRLSITDAGLDEAASTSKQQFLLANVPALLPAPSASD
ncbi:MAG: hypothetical protein LQ348_006753 [Seirophora lacunosa]|nr:MAG: hypothetical protein LQ348_006753 [Seirophora lacunosa]